MRLTLALTLALLALSLQKCPSSCQLVCRIPGDPCLSCIGIFHQLYSFSQQTCICQPGFTHFLESEDYCCPFECESCGTFGCTTCDSSSYLTVQWGDLLKPLYLNCSCNENFYLNRTTHKCICMSSIQPQNYYYNPVTGDCYRCPEGCRCSSQGCIQCSNQTNRVVEITSSQTYDCPCVHNYHEAFGICSCPDSCVCSDSQTVLFCDSDSHRYNSFGNWICNPPYTQFSGSCQCMNPYYISPAGQCVCSTSMIGNAQDSMLAYSYQGVCYQCLGACTCDYRGCVSCPKTSKYRILNGSCFCGENYTRAESLCLCGNPYYQIDGGNCMCMSELSQSLYYYDQVQKACHRCPAGCFCDSRGCYQCSDSTLRSVSVNPQGQYVCYCQTNSVQNKLGVCVCISPYVLSKDGYSCLCNATSVANVYYGAESGLCRWCPTGCVCINGGCAKCFDSTLRAITKNSLGISTCDCILHAQENSSSICECFPPYSLNPDTLECQCSDPYFLQNSACLCKAALFPTQYYWDAIRQSCRVCPSSCICNQLGCIACTNDSLRYIVTLQTSSCECWQQSMEIDNQCLICESGYFYDGECIQCQDCATCERRGCLSCLQGFDLVNFSCVCKNSSLINWRNTCICPLGHYNDTEYCQPCPNNCKECFLSEYRVFCRSCNTNVSRAVEFSSQCPCIKGYKQLFPIEKYCCHQFCLNCTESGCTSCYPFSYRTVYNNSCSCVYPFVESGFPYCVCDQGFYLCANECLPCPQHCLTCKFNPQIQNVDCLSCHSSSNRNLSSLNCSCLPSYSETNPVSYYCVARYCTFNTVDCTQCKSPRVITGGICLCPDGYFQNYMFQCAACSIPGCVMCLSADICIKCNMSDYYYLTSKTCTKRNLLSYLYTYAADHSGIIVQFVLNESVYGVSSVSVSMFEINTGIVSTPLLSITETAYSAILYQGNVITIVFPNADITYQNVLFSFLIRYYRFNSEKQRAKYSLFHKTVYSDSLLSMFKFTHYCIGVTLYVFVVMGFAYYLYLLGYKHNQVMFSIQSFSLCIFGLYKPNLDHISVLYYLRASYFGFGSGPFAAYIPPYYIQAAPRNYRFLTTDSNIFRVTGILIILVFFLGIVLLLSRLVYMCLQSLEWKLSKTTVKFVYRTNELLYKVMMFPILFFCIQTFFNWNLYLYTDSGWKTASHALSVFLAVMYFLVTLIQIKYEMIPRSSKIQNLSEFLSAVTTSIIIISNQNININRYLYLLIVPFLARDGVYIYNLYRYCDFVFSSYLSILFPSFLQIVPLIVMLSANNRNLLFASVVVLNIFQIIVPIYIIVVFNKHQKRDKITIAIIEKHEEEPAESAKELSKDIG